MVERELSGVTEPAELEEERDFLLRSIRDLDAERAAGDIDEADYQSLRDDYTARAAAVLRVLSAPAPPVSELVVSGGGASTRGRLIGAAIGSLAVAGLAAWLIVANTSHRQFGQALTGSIASLPAVAGRDSRLDQAQKLFVQGKPADAIRLYDAVLKDAPKQPEALAYKGWMLRLAGLSDLGLKSLDAAEAAAPSYPDAHFFRGVILLEDKGDAAGAVREIRFFLASNPPPDAIPRAEAELQQALRAGGPSVATTVDPRLNPQISSNFGSTPTTTAGP